MPHVYLRFIEGVDGIWLPYIILHAGFQADTFYEWNVLLNQYKKIVNIFPKKIENSLLFLGKNAILNNACIWWTVELFMLMQAFLVFTEYKIIKCYSDKLDLRLSCQIFSKNVIIFYVCTILT